MGASGPCSNCKGLCEQGREVRGMGTRELRSKSVNEEMANHSNIIAWRIPWTAEPVDYSSWSCKKSDMTEQLTVRRLRLEGQQQDVG